MLKAYLLSLVVIAGLFGPAAGSTAGSGLATAALQSPVAGESASFDGVVEAVRQTVMSAQAATAQRYFKVALAGESYETAEFQSRVLILPKVKPRRL